MLEEPLAIALCDFDNLSRSALELLFSDENVFELVRSVRDAALLPESSRDIVVLMDPMVGWRLIPDALSTARARMSNGIVVVYTTSVSSEVLRAALDVGAQGFVVKGRVDDMTLVSIVHLARRRGLVIVDESVREFFVSQSWRLNLSMAPPRIADLSGREREILQALASGMYDEEIAKEFSMSVSTVRTHLRRAEVKLKARGRVQAVAIATTLQLINPRAHTSSMIN